MDHEKIFARRVYELRKKKHMSQKELGEVLGLTSKSISTIESGLRSTTIEKLILLAKFFEVSADYLLGLTDEP